MLGFILWSMTVITGILMLLLGTPEMKGAVITVGIFLALGALARSLDAVKKAGKE